MWLGVLSDALGWAGGGDVYGQCKIGHDAWDDFAGRVLAIKMRRHTKSPEFTSSVIDIIVKFHLDLLAMVARVNSQVERLRNLDSRDDDGDEPAEEERSTASDERRRIVIL